MDQLTEEMKAVLFKMKWLLPWGTTTSYNGGGDGVPSSRPPAGVRLDGPSEVLPHVEWQRAWDRAVGTFAKERVLAAARADLDHWSHRPKLAAVAEETQVELEARMVKEGRGWDVKQVAQHFNCTPTFMRRVRLAAAVDASTGEGDSQLSPADEVRRARELAEDGLSERQIRMLLKCGGSKLQRLLGKAA